YPKITMGLLKYGIRNSEGAWLSCEELDVEVGESSYRVLNFEILFPGQTGDYNVCAELTHSETGRMAVSTKIAHVYGNSEISIQAESVQIGIIEEGREILDFLSSFGLSARKVEGELGGSLDLVVITGGARSRRVYEAISGKISQWVEEGHIVIFLEPERDAPGDITITLPVDRKLEINHREDLAEGGYDSYLIPTDIMSPIWNGIREVDLRIFNGGYGGEVVPQCDLKIDGKYEILAKSGLNLARPAVLEMQSGRGLVVISSVEMGGRLIARQGCYDSPYAVRPDPVVQLFLLNLVGFYSRQRANAPSRERGIEY
ncbi:MAG: hypothetical protein M1378_06485, partial [Bacteroidetes bacterium]|nr:hypothetical protein [Bacteroidota bacterium]